MRALIVSAFIFTAVCAAKAEAQQTSATNPSLPPELAAIGFQIEIMRTENSRHGWKETYFLGRLPDGSWLIAETNDGKLAEVKGNSIPSSLVAAMLPTSIQQSSELSQLARIVEIDYSPKGYLEIAGYSSEGHRLELEFFSDGKLKEFERSVLNSQLPSLEEIRQSLPRLGYQEIAFIQPKAKHVEILARNQQGQWMELRVKEDAQIHRERPWQR